METASSPPECLVDVLERERKVLGCPGLVAGFFDAGNKPQIASVGIARVGSEMPLHATDAVHLGSCTKALTALLIGDAISAGQLRFTTTLGALSPVWKKSPWVDCTVDDVLRHEAGFPENAKWWGLAGTGFDVTSQRRDVLNTKWLTGRRRTTRGKYAYSNVGYVVLGSVIDTVYGMPYEDVVQLRIARPNLLQTIGFRNPSSASGHRQAQQGYLPTTLDNPPVMNSAGRLHMSTGDWLQTASLHTDSSDFLSQHVRKQLQFSPVDGGYAGGWIVTKRSWAGGPALTHAGSNTFWFAVMWIAPKTGRAFAAVANAAGAEVSNGLDRIIGAMILKAGSTSR